MRLFPSFWGPLTARCRWRKIAVAGTPAPERSAIVPASRDDLLAPEVCAGFAEAGATVRPDFRPETWARPCPSLLRDHRPKLLFSINGKGLDPHGEVFHLLEAAGVPVVIWCVDNPFNLLSGLASPFWKRAWLCVTDASFAGPLHEHGARRVLHLPLAAWPGMFEDAAPCREQGLGGPPGLRGPLGLPGPGQVSLPAAPCPTIWPDRPRTCCAGVSGPTSTGGGAGWASPSCGRARPCAGAGARRVAHVPGLAGGLPAGLFRAAPDGLRRPGLAAPPAGPGPRRRDCAVSCVDRGLRPPWRASTPGPGPCSTPRACSCPRP